MRIGVVACEIAFIDISHAESLNCGLAASNFSAFFCSQKKPRRSGAKGAMLLTAGGSSEHVLRTQADG
jgi:hypothetical protein